MNTSNIINTSNVIEYDTTPQILTDNLKNKLNINYINDKRKIRNKLLEETDKYLIPDYPITSNQILEVKIYQQELRDYMNHFNIEIQSDFPTPPSFIPSFP